MVLVDAVDTKAEVTEIVLTDMEVADLVDNGNQVVERADGLKRGGIRPTEDAARGSQEERVFHDDGRHAAIVKIRRKETIVEADHASDSGRTAIRFENLADIILLGDFHDSVSRAVQPWGSRRGGPSTLRVWQKWRRRLSSASTMARLPRKLCHSSYPKFVVMMVGLRR